jgi:2-keto-4-pentenoate hydratase/2-oxohepta-3-ene-1,7-dioic acid hydratase in catechol pathway
VRLGTFLFEHGVGLGRVLDENQVLDLRLAAPELPRTMRQLLAAGRDALQLVRNCPSDGRAIRDLKTIEHLAPIPDPSKFLAIGMNYKDHVQEALRKGMKIPDTQLWFNKQVSCVTGSHSPVLLPKMSQQLDYEAELGVVIGTRCRHVSAEQARECIGGYLIVNDISVRDWQMRSPTFTLGKSYDSHGPIGPYLVTADEVEDPQNLDIQLFVDNELRQHGNTRDMIYSIDEQIAYLSSVLTLEPGDILATGTPKGVGAAMDPPRYLSAGSHVRIGIDRLGWLENTIVSEL